MESHSRRDPAIRGDGRMLKAEFVQSLGWSEFSKLEIKWIGAQGFVELDADRFVQIEMVEHGHKDHWVGLLACVVSRTTGVINSKLFSWGEFLTSDRTGSTDRLEVLSYVKWDWYGAKPASTQPLIEAIAGYVNLHRLPNSHSWKFKCRGRDWIGNKPLASPVDVVLRVSQSGENFSINVACVHNTGGHGQRCKASHPEVDKCGAGVACPYSMDIPYCIDNR